ncbi:MAG: permease [Pseudomonadota bacterium]
MKSADAPQRALSFDLNPRLSLPLRYFLTAPLFAALAAALLAWQGPAALLTRWSPQTLALTHLMVLGCLSMTMVGALLQLLPVVAGVALPRVGVVGGVVHIGLCLGTLVLAAAFWLEQALLFRCALTLLLATLLLFVAACTLALWRRGPGAGPVLPGIRLSLASLAITTLLGGLLAGAFAFPALAGLPLQRLTDLHAMWGLLGWVGLLVIAIAYQVVPMFMVTPPYPPLLTGGFTTTMFLLLASASISSGLRGPAQLFHQACLLLLVAGYATFGAVTLSLLARRKRPSADPTTLYWRTAMASLLAALALWLWPGDAHDNLRPLLLGVLLIAGFALSAIAGMLYKIVPFLTWYHLQETAAPGQPRLPGINKIIPELAAHRQFRTHALALLMLAAACWRPDLLARPAAALMGIACLWLWYNLATALRLYRRLRPPSTPPLTITATT